MPVPVPVRQVGARDPSPLSERAVPARRHAERPARRPREHRATRQGQTEAGTRTLLHASLLLTSLA